MQTTRTNDKTFIFEQEYYYCGDKYSQVDAYVISDFHTFALRARIAEIIFFYHDNYLRNKEKKKWQSEDKVTDT